MTTSRGVTIMKNVTSGTSLGHYKRAFAHLVAFLDGQTGTLEDSVDHFGRVEGIDGGKIIGLGHQMVPTLGCGGVDVVHDSVPARFQGAGKVARVEPDYAELQLHKRIRRKDEVEPGLALEWQRLSVVDVGMHVRRWREVGGQKPHHPRRRIHEVQL